MRFNQTTWLLLFLFPFRNTAHSLGLLREFFFSLNSSHSLPNCLHFEIFPIIFKSFGIRFSTCFRPVQWSPWSYFGDSHPEPCIWLRFSLLRTASQMSCRWKVQSLLHLALTNDPQEPHQSLDHHRAPQWGHLPGFSAVVPPPPSGDRLIQFRLALFCYFHSSNPKNAHTLWPFNSPECWSWGLTVLHLLD